MRVLARHPDWSRAFSFHLCAYPVAKPRASPVNASILMKSLGSAPSVGFLLDAILNRCSAFVFDELFAFLPEASIALRWGRTVRRGNASAFLSLKREYGMCGPRRDSWCRGLDSTIDHIYFVRIAPVAKANAAAANTFACRCDSLRVSRKFRAVRDSGYCIDGLPSPDRSWQV